MRDYSKVAVALFAIIASMFICESVNAQTRISLSQLRAAQARGQQFRTIKIRRPTQTPSTSSAKKSSEPKDKIPEAALLTERGKQLADRLRNLRYAEAQMGSKHPSLPSVQAEIESIKDELQAWVPAIKPKNGNGDDKVESAEMALAQLGEEDLRQLVVRLTLDIHRLRNRVVELESEQKKISSLVVERK